MWLQLDSILGIILTASILTYLVPGLGRLKQLGAETHGIPGTSLCLHVVFPSELPHMAASGQQDFSHRGSRL